MANLEQINSRIADPSLRELLDVIKEEVMIEINCHKLGTIQEFNFADQVCKATINYKKKLNGQLISYPVLIDCPAIILTGGKAGLTFPIKVGDTCLALFNDEDIDNWFSSGQVSDVSTPRRHAFTDAVVLVGVRSLQNKLAAYDTERAVLFNDKAKVAVGPSLIEISNDMTSLLQIINGLIDLLKTAVTIPTVPSSPATFDPSFIAELEAYKSDVEELLL